MNEVKILIVEDDKSIKNLMISTLKIHGYNYIYVNNGLDAINEASKKNADVIFLDLGLPDIDGFSVIKRIRSFSNIPIIVISSRSEDKDKILALDLGADDYLTKPFSVDELLARLRVTIRRLNYLDKSDFINFKNGALTINYINSSVYINKNEIHLTSLEYRLLCLLAKNIGKILTYEFIKKSLWDNTIDHELGNLRVFMATLRRKLENTNNEQYIETSVGLGYRMIKVN